jgi:hypothetical protein
MDQYVIAKARLEGLKGDLAPLSEYAIRYLEFGVDINSETLLVAPTKWVAPMARAFWLYEGLDPEWVPSDLEIPCFYDVILSQMNGCFAFDLSLFGLPTHDGLVNRTILRPLSIHSANRRWRHEFDGMGASFHFGAAALTDSENIGYFYVGENVVSVRKSGEVLQTWSCVSDLLRDELSRLEKRARDIPAAAAAWGRHHA